jgi:Zn finger protein HypA/HybF involved in hydrogenase expression
MHEMGIASSILEAAEKEARLYPGHRAAKIGVLIGEYAGVDTESLRFCFDVISRPAAIELDITWGIASEELKLAYVELEEVEDDSSCNREEGLKRERSNCGAAA